VTIITRIALTFAHPNVNHVASRALLILSYVKSNKIPLKNQLRRQSQATDVFSVLPWGATVLGEPQQKVEMCFGL
jgi:hypothetical protein